MNKIIFRISKNYLSVNIFNKDTQAEDLNNTNIIDTKELMFSTDYIKENLELVSSFLNVIIIKNEVTKIIIKNYDVINVSLDIIGFIPSIKELIIKPDKSINYEMFLKLLDNKYLTKINAYDIPPYLLERLDINKNLTITLRSEILFLSNFMNINNLTTYSNIYYKKYIIINDEFTPEDQNDFETFLSINKYLKIIEFIAIDEQTLEYILNKLIEHHISNIKITCNEEMIKANDIYNIITNYKKKHEKVLKNLDIGFNIKYSDNYKKKYLFKQINLNFIKVSLSAVIMVVVVMMGINYYHNYKDNQSFNDIENELNGIIKNESQTGKDNDGIEYITPGNTTTTTTTTSIYDIKYEKVFEKLLKINDDTKGWLTVNNTKIDYPVVQSGSNEYYLKRDYYKRSNRHGWIFMDYRNNINDMSKNTIIYGHNLSNQTMFGTLRYVLNSSWYKKTSNQIITFNTLNQNMNWQIISIYKIPVTSDYLTTVFSNDDEYINFLNMVVSRSIYNFNQSYNKDDQILTLSTCGTTSDERLVIHAKLIKES